MAKNKSFAKTIELAEKLTERVGSVGLDKKGTVQVRNGITVEHDERRGLYVIRVAIGGHVVSLELRDVSNVIEFVAGAV